VKFLYWAVSLNGTSCCNGIVAVVIIIGCCKRIYMHHIHKRNLELMNLFFDDDMYWIQDFGFVTTNLLLFMWKQNLKNTPNACVWFFFQFQLFWNRNKAFWHIYARRMITEVVIPPSYRLGKLTNINWTNLSSPLIVCVVFKRAVFWLICANYCFNLYLSLTILDLTYMEWDLNVQLCVLMSFLARRILRTNFSSQKLVLLWSN